MRNFFKRIFRKQKEFVYTTQNMVGAYTANGPVISNWTHTGGFVNIDDLVVQDTSNAIKPNIDERKQVEPKEVFEEIKRSDPQISFENLDEKIKSVKERLEILSEHLSKDQLKDEARVLWYLQNRKKYLKTKSKYPIDWAMTTREAVDDLCKNYKLKTVPLKQYYTLLPKEAVKELKRYTETYKKITKDEPIFELVIKDIPETKKKDRDPILLANSPLGNFLFIIGVWDDEVEIIDEIIYQGR